MLAIVTNSYLLMTTHERGGPGLEPGLPCGKGFKRLAHRPLILFILGVAGEAFAASIRLVLVLSHDRYTWRSLEC
jgi:hypothetical protein